MKKKLLSLTLALTLCLGLTVPVFAKDVKDATKQDILNTFTIYRNGSVNEMEGDYLVDTPFKLLLGLDPRDKVIEKEGYRAISKDDSWTITNTGSTELTMDGDPDYELSVKLTRYDPRDGANDEYVYRRSYDWINENCFSSNGYEKLVRLKAGESVTIPASAFLTADGGEADPGPVFELGVEVSFTALDDMHTWQTYKVYLYEGLWDTLASGTFCFMIDEAQIDSAGPITPAEPEPPSAPAVSFTDVPKGQYYAAAVSWAVANGITNGTGSGTTFSPDEKCSQIQILTFLYRAARGEGAASGADMDKAVSWAREKGMIDDAFDGSTPCTRATAMKYIWQALGKESVAGDGFSDVPADADYAAAVSWGVANGVTNGYGDTFRPGETCTRGQIVTFLHRAYVPEAALK